MMKSRFRILLAAAFLFASLQVIAGDAFNNYVADVHLLESYQLRSPESIIRYSDGDNGVLLKSVLEPARMREMLTISLQRMRQGGTTPNLPQLLTPLLNRYEKAFEAQGVAYEGEYLDSVEAAAFLGGTSIRMMNGVPMTPPVNKDGSKPSADQVQLFDSLNALVKGMSTLLASVNTQFATEIRKRVASGKFSAEGAKRALKLADSLSAPQ